MLVSLFGPLYPKPQSSNSLPPAPQGMQERHGLKMSIWFLKKAVEGLLKKAREFTQKS